MKQKAEKNLKEAETTTVSAAWGVKSDLESEEGSQHSQEADIWRVGFFAYSLLALQGVSQCTWYIINTQ
jgi:hypothetical protein